MIQYSINGISMNEFMKK